MNNKLAVVGIDINLSNSENKNVFWKNLIEGKKCYKELTKKQMGKNIDKYQSNLPESEKFYYNKMAFIDTEKTEHELLLESVKKAFNDGCIKPGGERCGIINGSLSFPNENLNNDIIPHYYNSINNIINKNTNFSNFIKNSNGPDLDYEQVLKDPASYVAKKLNLGNIHYSIDAACATSLYLFKLAEYYLSNNIVDMFICSAVSKADPYFIMNGFSLFTALPSNSVSTPFCKKTGGLTPGEGVGTIILKRLEDAVNDNNKIYGIINGITLNNGGVGMPLKPFQKAQYDCLKNTYDKYKIDPKTIDYIECHATGTPVGDIIEINVIKDYFGDNYPMFGSSKGNFGHCLTLAGIIGTIKLLLSLQHEYIPKTPDVQESLDKNVLINNLEWKKTKKIRRAGISAFGFGNTNAHAIIEEYKITGKNEYKNEYKQEAYRFSPLSIIGIGILIGDISDIDKFESAIYRNNFKKESISDKRLGNLRNEFFLKSLGIDKYPEGCFIKEYDINYKLFKTSLLEKDQLIDQQLIGIQAINNAILDSKIEKGKKYAVLIGLGTELQLYRLRGRATLDDYIPKELSEEDKKKIKDFLYFDSSAVGYTSCIGNILATRISSIWNFTGPSFTITEGENSTMRCIELANFMINNMDIEGAIIGGVDLNCSLESIYLKNKYYKNYNISKIGEGAAAIVVKRFKKDSKEKSYCVIENMQVDKSYNQAIFKNLDKSKININNIDYLELSSISEDNNELSEIYKLYGGNSNKLCAIGSFREDVGNFGYCSALISIIKCSLCMYNRYIPKSEMKNISLDKDSSLYIPFESFPWVKEKDNLRYSLVNSNSITESKYSVLLSDRSQNYNQYNNISLDKYSDKILLFSGNTIEKIKYNLNIFLTKFKIINNTFEGENYFYNYIKNNSNNIDSEYKFIIICNSETCIEKIEKGFEEIEKAKNKINKNQCKKNYYHNKCYFFKYKSIEKQKIAFVYGDSTTPYYGLGIDLNRIFPQLHGIINDNAPGTWNKSKWWNIRANNFNSYIDSKGEFNRNQIELFRNSVYHSYCYTKLIMDYFKIIPESGIGMSVGEIAMLIIFSQHNLRICKDITNNLYQSKTWTEELSIKFKCLKDNWELVDCKWQGFMVNENYMIIENEILDNKYIKILIINTPSSTIIAGELDECLKLLKKLKCLYIKFDLNLIVHCDLTDNYYKEIASMHDELEIPDTNNIDLYNSDNNTIYSPQKKAGNYFADI